MSDPITAVAKAVEKLGRIGEMLLGPRTLREEAKAKAESIPIVTKAEIASDDLKVEAHRRRELEDVRHFTNLAAAFHDAKTQIEFLGAKKLLPENASQGESDPDWFHKWAGYAKETSDTDIRALWAKVLAGELVQPGRFSLRLLHCVSLFRKSEAQNFSLLANYFCRDQEGRILFLETRRTEDQLLKNVGIGASLFRSLENIGLLQRPKEPRGTPLYIQRSTVHYGEHAYTLKMLHVPNPMTSLFVSLNPRELTELGEELYALCEVAPDREYEKMLFADILGGEGSGWSVSTLA